MLGQVKNIALTRPFKENLLRILCLRKGETLTLQKTQKIALSFFLTYFVQLNVPKSKPCRKHKKLAVSSRCVSSASCRAILTGQQLINLRNVSKYFDILLFCKNKKKCPNPFPFNNDFNEPAGREANLLGLRSSPERDSCQVKMFHC